MKAFSQLERMKEIIKLIKAERSGNPEQLADHLGISRRQLYNYLDEIKAWGIEIEYSKSRETYFFNEGHELEINYSVKVIRQAAIREINGGFFRKNLQRAFFVHSTCLTCIAS